MREANDLADSICWAVAEAERLKGSAPNTPEYVVVYQENFGRKVNYGFLNAYINNLYREDLFYADKQFTFWSM